jgi:protein-tyrosine phosphatase
VQPGRSYLPEGWKSTSEIRVISDLVDIHAHLLPGIDDGPPELADALEMARAAVQGGIETMAVTPHLRPDFPQVKVEEIAMRCEQLRGELAAAGIPLRIVPGSEASLLWALEADEQELRVASYGQLGSDLLIEAPDEAPVLEQMLHAVQERGFRVTLAHAERNHTLQRHPSRLRALRDQGLLVQINAGALRARRGSGERRFAEALCRWGLADVLASDGHRGTEWRPVTDLAEGIGAAARLVGKLRAHWMASEAPAAIIAGAELPPAPPVDPADQPWWRRLSGWV